MRTVRPALFARGVSTAMPAKQLVWQCGISGAKPDRFGFWSLSRVLEQPARAVPPSTGSTGRCDPERSLRPAPSGPRDAPSLPDTNGIDLRGRSGVKARHPDSADFRRGRRLPCVSSATWPVCGSGAGAAASVPGRPAILMLPLRGRSRRHSLNSPPECRHLSSPRTDGSSCGPAPAPP